jgi:hypothetical protein
MPVQHPAETPSGLNPTQLRNSQKNLDTHNNLLSNNLARASAVRPIENTGHYAFTFSKQNVRSQLPLFEKCFERICLAFEQWT